MKNIKNLFSRFTVNTLTKLKNRSQKFKEKIEEAKLQPRSKRKSLLLGFTTALGIFGVTLFTSVLPAVAKDIPKQTPNGVAPANQPTTSNEIVKGISGVAASVCDLAVSSGSFVIGAACGIVVVYGILKVQGK